MSQESAAPGPFDPIARWRDAALVNWHPKVPEDCVAMDRILALAERAALVDAVREVWPNAFAAPLALMGFSGVRDTEGRRMPQGSWGVFGCASDVLPLGPDEPAAWQAALEGGRAAKETR